MSNSNYYSNNLEGLDTNISENIKGNLGDNELNNNENEDEDEDEDNIIENLDPLKNVDTDANEEEIIDEIDVDKIMENNNKESIMPNDNSDNYHFISGNDLSKDTSTFTKNMNKHIEESKKKNIYQILKN
jgi:hypothetical protein